MSLPALPRACLGAGGPARVIRVRRIVNDGIVCDGLWNADTRTISIARGLSRERAWWVYFHERTHMEIEDGGIDIPIDLEETICNTMATARVAELRRLYVRRTRKRPRASGRSSATGKMR